MNTPLPSVGHAYEVRFGETVFRLDFDTDARHLTFSSLGEAISNEPDQTVEYTAVPLRDGLFLVYWQEATGTTVTHVQDYAQGLVHTNITGTDDSFFNSTGTLKPLD